MPRPKAYRLPHPLGDFWATTGAAEALRNLPASEADNDVSQLTGSAATTPSSSCPSGNGNDDAESDNNMDDAESDIGMMDTSQDSIDEDHDVQDNYSSGDESDSEKGRPLGELDSRETMRGKNRDALPTDSKMSDDSAHGNPDTGSRYDPMEITSSPNRTAAASSQILALEIDTSRTHKLEDMKRSIETELEALVQRRNAAQAENEAKEADMRAERQASGISKALWEEYEAFCEAIEPKFGSRGGWSMTCDGDHDGSYVDYDPHFDLFKDIRPRLTRPPTSDVRHGPAYRQHPVRSTLEMLIALPDRYKSSKGGWLSSTHTKMHGVPIPSSLDNGPLNLRTISRAFRPEDETRDLDERSFNGAA
ncbi:Uu.00g050130.m01.CDS01 [Anthostomella pinea]|uniref:Uu.00g050130.m01.CDS01 n=1 Tax=Anthostomella pinea TaxID=933095 RepID=A0AAI8YMR0_9PEZI|nr:Uu.00g050130.m01.CDS01 [Anthostomella pinea]